MGGILLLVISLVPVENSSDKGRDQSDLGFSTGNGLGEGEQEGQIAVDVIFGLELLGSLDTLPGRSDLNQNSLGRNSCFFV